jgi:hypothetical protein
VIEGVTNPSEVQVDKKLVRLKLDVLPPKHSLAIMHEHCPAGCTRSHIASQPDDVGTRLPLAVKQPWSFNTAHKICCSVRRASILKAPSRFTKYTVIRKHGAALASPR